LDLVIGSGILGAELVAGKAEDYEVIGMGGCDFLLQTGYQRVSFFGERDGSFVGHGKGEGKNIPYTASPTQQTVG